MKTGTRNVLIAILVLAAVCRLVALLDTPDYELRTDAFDYHRHGAAIAAGDGYPDSILAPGGGPTAFRPPAYPFLVGGLYAVFGSDPDVARYAQIPLGVITVGLIALIAGMIWGARVGLLSGLLAAVYPHFLVSGTTLLSEPFFLSLELGAVAAALAHRRSDHPFRWLILVGVLAGLASLTRSNGIVLLLPLLIAIWPPRVAPRRLRVLQPLVLVAVTCLTIAPWTVRNAIEMDSFIPIASQSGFALAGTYNDDARLNPDGNAQWLPPTEVEDFSSIFAPGSELQEVEMDQALRTLAREYAIDHPWYVPRVALNNSIRTLDLAGLDYAKEIGSYNDVPPRAVTLAVLGFWILGLVALIGVFTQAVRRAPVFLWVIPVLMILSVIFIADSAGRYRLPAEPFLIMLAALGIAWAFDRVRELRGSGDSISGGG